MKGLLFYGGILVRKDVKDINHSSKLRSRFCLVCEKPFKGKTKLCPTCNKLRKTDYKYPIAISTLVFLKNKYPHDNIFSIIKNNPEILYKTWNTTTKKERLCARNNQSDLLSSDKYKNAKHKKTDNIIPEYIQELFKRDKTKTLICISGERANPKIYYRCEKCGKDRCQTYDNLRRGQGHNCDANKSSGEVVIEEYLKAKGIRYKTQHNTLKCLNPKTNNPLPYDFEIPEKRLIIEIQGEQHYKYIPYFHESLEDFNYQVWKDEYKKRFAEKNGYRIIYINYSDIQLERYKELI